MTKKNEEAQYEEMHTRYEKREAFKRSLSDAIDWLVTSKDIRPAWGRHSEVRYFIAVRPVSPRWNKDEHEGVMKLTGMREHFTQINRGFDYYVNSNDDANDTLYSVSPRDTLLSHSDLEGSSKYKLMKRFMRQYDRGHDLETIA